MVKFELFLIYEGERFPRLIAKGCSKEQLLDVLSRHLMLSEVLSFQIFVHEDCDDSFEEFTL